MRTTSGKDWIRESTRQAIYHRDGDRCVACGSRELSLDHVIPSGGNHPTNLVTLCSADNREKSDRTIAEWRPDLVELVAEHTARPLDRAEGLRRFKELRPSRYAQEQFRQSKEGRALAAARRAARELQAFEGFT